MEKTLKPTGSGMTHGKFPKGHTLVSLLFPRLPHGLGSWLILGSDFLISSWAFLLVRATEMFLLTTPWTPKCVGFSLHEPSLQVSDTNGVWVAVL